MVYASQGTSWESSLYNALGQRVAETMPDGTDNRTLIYPRDIFGHRTEIFDDRPSQDWAGADQWWARVAGQRILMGGSTSWMRHANAMGSTTMDTDQAGNVEGDVTYYPWGEVWEGGGSNGDAFGDLEFQINYPLPPSATRDYNPPLGRWTTPDPLGGDITNPQSLNRYAYVDNNPTTYTDPSGLIRHDPWGCFTDETGMGYYCPNADDEQPSDFAFGFVNPVLPPFLPGGNGQGRFLIHMTVTSKAPAAGQPQSLGNVFTCASDFAEKYSIAGGLHALGIGTSGVGGFVTNALGGNMFSGATDLYESIRNGSAGGHNVFYNMGQGVLAGPLQGVPGVRGPWGASVSDLVTGAIAGAYYNGVTGAGETLTTLTGEVGLSSATMTAAEFATGVGIAKFVYDSLTYVGGGVGCALGVIH